MDLILDVESHDGNRKLDHKTKSQLESIQESVGGGGVRYAPESDSELDTLSEESEDDPLDDDIEESIVLDNNDDDQVYSIQNQSRKIRRSVSDKLKPTTSCDSELGRPRWPSSNALS